MLSKHDALRELWLTEGTRARRGAKGESVLIARAKHGDAGALDELYRRYKDYVYTLCLNLCGDREDAEDLLQETFVHAWRGLPKFSGRSSLSTWLYRIAVNVAHDAARRGSSDLGPPHPATEADAETIYQVRLVLSHLKPVHRVTLILRYALSLSHREIAECLGWSLSRAKVTLHRAKRAFKHEYLRTTDTDEIEL